MELQKCHTTDKSYKIVTMSDLEKAVKEIENHGKGRIEIIVSGGAMRKIHASKTIG